MEKPLFSKNITIFYIEKLGRQETAEISRYVQERERELFEKEQKH